ncbi:MAG: hypothetical protein HY062_11885 [Bacteroidetes bacterium]|nr:hypothetical protein [Bacteroidota bacterium]
MHIFFSFCLLISFSWQCAAKSIIYVGFAFNQKRLAETVCVNRNKPKSCCAAKCYLDKEIKKEDKRQSNSPSSIKDKAEKSELRTGLVTFVFLCDESVQSPHFIYSKNFPNTFLSSVFHPPGI